MWSWFWITQGEIHFRPPVETPQSAAPQHTVPRCASACIYMRESCQHMRGVCEGKAREEQRDEGSGFWLKHNLWRSHSMSWQPSVNPGGERAEPLWSNTHTHPHTQTNTERLHQHGEAQTDRWANSWLTVCYETLSLCQWNQNNILGVNAECGAANTTPHGRGGCICTAMHQKKKKKKRNVFVAKLLQNAVYRVIWGEPARKDRICLPVAPHLPQSPN